MYRTLRIVRIIIAAVATLAIACALLNVCGIGDAIGDKLLSMQIVPALAAASLGWLSVWFGATLLFGRIYCSVACPLGVLMDVASAVAYHLTPKHRRREYRYVSSVSWVRVASLIAIIEAECLGFTLLLSILDPYRNFGRVVKIFGAVSASGLVAGLLIFSVITLIAVMRRGRLICNTACPVGAMLGAASRLSLMRFDINPDACTHCGKCETVCKSQCIKQITSQVDNSRCVVCFNCVAACPDKAITWRVGQHRLQWPLIQRIFAPKTRAAASMSSPIESTSNNNETISRPPTKNIRRRDA